MNFDRKAKSENKFQGHNKEDKLPGSQRAAHGVGHVLNDLVSSFWFSYLIIYLTKVVNLSNRLTGLVILLGQIADGILTPFIGIICDRTVCSYGRRKIWHLIGTVIVSATFPLLMIRILKQSTSDALKMVYYVGISGFLQFGFGCVQISHLSLIPEMSRQADERVELNAIRSAITFLCGIYVYGVTWVLLGQSSEHKINPNVWQEFMYLSFIIVGTGNIFSIIFHVVVREPKSAGYLKRQEIKLNKDKKPSDNASVISGSEQTSSTKVLVTLSFENAALDDNTDEINNCHLETSSKISSNYVTRDCVTNKTVDCVTEMNNNAKSSQKTTKIPTNCVTNTSQVNCVTPEGCSKPGHIIDNVTKNSSDCVTKLRPRTRTDWLKSPAFYKTAVVYMCSRLVVNISQSYLALYLTETLDFEKEAIAYFPLVVLISGVLSSLTVKTINRNLGFQITFVLGTTLSICACVWFYLQAVDMRNGVYAATVLMGSGGSVMLVTSLSMIADLVGDDKTFGAFIYGAISFCDKMSSGVVIAIIQELNPSEHEGENCSECNRYIRQVQSIAPGVAAVVGLLTVLLFYKPTFVCKRRAESCDAEVQVNFDQSWTEKQPEMTPVNNGLVPSTLDCVAQIHCNHDNNIAQLGMETRF